MKYILYIPKNYNKNINRSTIRNKMIQPLSGQSIIIEDLNEIEDVIKFLFERYFDKSKLKLKVHVDEEESEVQVIVEEEDWFNICSCTIIDCSKAVKWKTIKEIDDTRHLLPTSFN